MTRNLFYIILTFVLFSCTTSKDIHKGNFEIIKVTETKEYQGTREGKIYMKYKIDLLVKKNDITFKSVKLNDLEAVSPGVGKNENIGTVSNGPVVYKKGDAIFLYTSIEFKKNYVFNQLILEYTVGGKTNTLEIEEVDEHITIKLH